MMFTNSCRWENTTHQLSAFERVFQTKGLERNYVLNGEVEMSYFKSFYTDYPDEIYIRFGVLTGVIYVDPESSKRLLLKLMHLIKTEYREHQGVPSKGFIFYLMKKYCLEWNSDACIPLII